MTWADFISKLTQNPLEALLKFGAVCGSGLLHHWWQVLLALLILILARAVTFGIIDLVVPKSLSEKPPRWARTRVTSAWHKRLYRESLESRNLQRTRAVISLIKSLVDPLMGIITFFTVFGLLGITMTATTGTFLVGALSLALGLGTQGVIKDIIGGITILLADAYAVGDYVDTQFGAAGTVRHIGMRLTTLEAADGTIWYIRHSDIAKIGNLTASKAVVVTDVTFTWNEEDKHLKAEDLSFAESLLDQTVNELAEALDHVDKAARTLEAPDDTQQMRRMASVLPQLVPTLSADTLTDMRAITSDMLEEEHCEEAQALQSAVKRIPGRVPIFTKVETLGLVNSTVNSVTLRLRITLPPKASRRRAMAVLRRAIFESFVAHDISSSYSEVPESELPQVGEAALLFS